MTSCKETSCRLCRKYIADKDFQVIDSVTRDILDVLLLKLEFCTERQDVICNSCNKKLRAALDFKSTCLHTNNAIIPHVDCEEMIRVDLNEVYIKVNGSGHVTSISYDDKICRLCMKVIKGEIRCIEEEELETIQKFVPGMNIMVIKDPVMCTPCFDSLCTHNTFLKNCLDGEQRTRDIGTSDTDIEIDTSLSHSFIKNEAREESIINEEIEIKTESFNIKSEVEGRFTKISSEHSDEKYVLQSMSTQTYMGRAFSVSTMAENLDGTSDGTMSLTEKGPDSPSDSMLEFNSIVSKVGVDIPANLKKLIQYCGWDSVVAFQNIKDSDIDAMEQFAREDMPELLEEKELKNFFGIFARKPSLFKIHGGHRQLMYKIKQICQDMVLEQNCSCKCKAKTSSKNKHIVHSNTNTAQSQDPRTSKKLRNKQNPEQNTADDDKSHIHRIIQNYVKKFCNNELKGTDTANIINDIGNLEIYVTDSANEQFAKIKCFLCEATIKISRIQGKYGKKWIASNFNQHFKSHFRNKDDKTGQIKTMKNSSLLDYFHNVQDSVQDNNNRPFIVVDEICQDVGGLDGNNVSDSEIESNLPVCPVAGDNTIFFGQGRTSSEAGSSALKNDRVKHAEPSKWTHEKYSRTRRHLRKVDWISENQLKITSFFELKNQIMSALASSKDVESNIMEICTNEYEMMDTNMINLLDALIKHAKQNTKTANNNRFSEELKKFCLYLFLIGGKPNYETLQQNLQNILPSLSSVRRSLKENVLVTEGSVRINELKTYLLKRQLPLRVFVSEDQTAIVRRIQYEPNSNKLIGVLLPTNKNTGFPETDKFTVTRLKDIQGAFENEIISNNAYVFMAQPLRDKVPAFCLCIFGSNNKFTYEEVSNRWKFLISAAQKCGITIEGFSSGGDTRCLKAMKEFANFPDVEEKNELSPYFQMRLHKESITVMQDTVHILTKMKTRLLNPNLALTMGNYTVSYKLIVDMVEQYTEDKHFLTKSDLDSTDKMNFEATQKLCSDAVMQTLQQIPQSNGIIKYLQLMQKIYKAFLDKSLTCKERIFNIWYVIFVLRAWRHWIFKQKYTDKYFITSNTYTGIELNGHALVILIEKLKNNMEEFLPWLFSSQPCRKIFRQTRSMTTTFSTIANFSMLDILRRLSRIQIINEVVTDLGDSFCFPREKSTKLGSLQNQLNDICSDIPDMAEIKRTILQARDAAGLDAYCLGINADEEHFSTIHLKGNLTRPSQDEQSEAPSDSDQEDERAEEVENGHISENELSDIEDINCYRDREDLNLTDFSDKHSILEEHGAYLTVTLKSGKQMTLKKSSLCWLFSEKQGRLSADRLLRVRGMTTKTKRKDSITATTTTSAKRLRPVTRKHCNKINVTESQDPEVEYISEEMSDKAEDSDDQLIEKNQLRLHRSKFK